MNCGKQSVPSYLKAYVANEQRQDFEEATSRSHRRAQYAGAFLVCVAFLAMSLSTARISVTRSQRPAVVTEIDQLTRGRYRAHMFANVSVTRDVPYDGVLTLDVYSPSNDPDRARATVAWFHPG
jgi:hypothetical protein